MRRKLRRGALRCVAATWTLTRIHKPQRNDYPKRERAQKYKLMCCHRAAATRELVRNPRDHDGATNQFVWEKRSQTRRETSINHNADASEGTIPPSTKVRHDFQHSDLGNCRDRPYSGGHDRSANRKSLPFSRHRTVFCKTVGSGVGERKTMSGDGGRHKTFAEALNQMAMVH